jgi:anti-anti-sigma regulatory factor
MQITPGPNRCIVHLAGHLNAAQVPELRRVCDTAAGPVRIDLTDLLSADAVGLDALRRLRRAGAELVGIARYLRRSLV